MGIIACLNFLNQIYQMGRKLSRLISGGVNLKIGKKHSITYFLIFILTACSGNTIDFDSENNIVFSPDGDIITNLYVHLEESNRTFYITKKKNAIGSSFIKLDSIGDMYIVRGGDVKAPIIPQLHSHYIPIIKDEEYEIRNDTHGDATSYKLLLYVDSNMIMRKINR